MEHYIIGLDQSTQGTKALLFNQNGQLVLRTDLPHKQIIGENGWVSHDGDEIYHNTLQVIRDLIHQSGIDKSSVVGLGISNQRETSLIWDRETGEPLAYAVVWQCARATTICERESIKCHADEIFHKTGIRLSPYFPAAKIAWLLEQVNSPEKTIDASKVCCGTIDSYLVYRLTNTQAYLTDYSNASRTQLFNIFSLEWDRDICSWFGINPEQLPKVVDSNSYFGLTDCEGFFESPIPIHCVMGDSHAALFGQNCRSMGMAKATYGTGSSIMMNIAEKPVLSKEGLVTSLAWGIDGRVEYVLEGNLNYTGAVVNWLKDSMKLICHPRETETLVNEANQNDNVYLVPAFTGLGTPYWNDRARASVIGMDRTTGRPEFVRAALECIAYQIADVVFTMEKDSQRQINSLRVDGGPTGNHYLMQFQSNILQKEVCVPAREELSGIGVAKMAGMALGLWSEDGFNKATTTTYAPTMAREESQKKYIGWKRAVATVLENASDPSPQ